MERSILLILVASRMVIGYTIGGQGLAGVYIAPSTTGSVTIYKCIYSKLRNGKNGLWPVSMFCIHVVSSI